MGHLKIGIILLLFVSTAFSESIAQTVASHEKNGSLAFTENKNQWEEQVLFKAKLNAGSLFLEKDRFTFNLLHPEDLDAVFGHKHDASAHEHSLESIRSHAYQVIFKNSNVNVETKGADKQEGYSNFYLGDDPDKWAAGVFSYGKISYENLYSNINLDIYQSQNHLKYDFIIKPGGKVGDIQMEYKGVDNIFIQDGHLKVITSVNTITEQKPVAWQIIDGRKVMVKCNFNLKDNIVSFNFPNGYDDRYELIIDPVLVFSSYSGSYANNWGYTATYDDAGNLYAAGAVFNYGYPITTGAYNAFFSGGAGFYPTDVGITKFSPTGTSLIYSTYLGGSGNEIPHSMVVNASGELYVFGSTGSNNFPLTAGAVSLIFNGGTNYTTTALSYPNGTDMYISRFNAAGTSLLSSTYIGGTGNDGQNVGALYYNYADNGRGEINLDASGNVIVASCTYSTNFPVSSGAPQAFPGGQQDGVVFKMNPGLTSLLWSTYIGGSSNDAAYSVKVDPSGKIFAAGGTVSSNFPVVTGSLLTVQPGGAATGWVASYNLAGTALQASSYIGTNAYNQVHFVEIDTASNVYLFGQTSGPWPVSPGVYSNANSGQFIVKLNNALSTVLLSTVVGKSDGTPDISPTAFLVDICGNIYISGWGGTTNGSVGTIFGMPVSSNAYKSTTDGSDIYVMVLGPDATFLRYATYFGGNVSAEHVDGGTSRFDKNGIIYQAVCAGCWNNSDFPSTPGAWSSTNNAGASACNLGVFKFDLSFQVNAAVSVTPSANGCAPYTVNFQNSSTNAITYKWDFGDGTPVLTTASPSHTFVNPGIYDVMLIAIDSNTCNIADTSFLTITVKSDTVKADFTMATFENCDSLQIALTNTSYKGHTWAWSSGNNVTSSLQNPVFTYYSPGTYQVRLIATDTTTCNVKDTMIAFVKMKHRVDAGSLSPDSACVPFVKNFQQNATGANQYYWDFGDGNYDTINNPSHTYQSTGTFPVVFVAIDTASCNIADTALTSIKVINDTVVADFSYTDLKNCDSLVITLNNTSQYGLDWYWDFGDNSSSILKDPQHTYYQHGQYTITLVAVDTTKCNLADTFSLQVELLDRVTADFSGFWDVCFPGEIQLDNNCYNATSYTWDFGDGNTSTLTTPSHIYGNPGLYNIILVADNPNTCNLSDTISGTAEIYPKPVADFYVLPSGQILLGQTVTFVDSSTNASSWFWKLGDGNTSISSSPINVYYEEGIITVCLDIISPDGCEDTICKTLEIIDDSKALMPNAFSPNGDGTNDILYAGGAGVSKIMLKIYNRWGVLLFETTDLQKGWDGKYNGQPQPVGTYVYYMNLTLLNGKEMLVKGNITLLR